MTARRFHDVAILFLCILIVDYMHGPTGSTSSWQVTLTSSSPHIFSRRSVPRSGIRKQTTSIMEAKEKATVT